MLATVQEGNMAQRISGFPGAQFAGMACNIETISERGRPSSSAYLAGTEYKLSIFLTSSQ